MLPKLAIRSTITSRVRAQRNCKGDSQAKTNPNTPHIERSRASSVCEEVLKPCLAKKEKTFVAIDDVPPVMDTDDLKASDDVKCNMTEQGGGDEEMMYVNKTQEFELLKKDLEERQSAIVLMYSNLNELHGKMEGAGHEVLPLEPVLQLLDLSQVLRGPVSIGDGLELPKIITELPAQLIAACHEILTSRDAVVNCLKIIGSANEVGKTNLANKIRQLGIEGEKLCTLVDDIAQTTDRSALHVSKRVYELVQQAMNLNSENVLLKEEQLQLKTQLEQAKKQNSRTLADAKAKQQPASLIRTPFQYSGQRKVETDNASGKEDVMKKQHDLELRTLRSRIRDLERELKELNTAHGAQTEMLKSLETEIKQRESQHGNRLLALRDQVRNAEQKMNAFAEERNKLHTSLQNAQEEAENLLCGLKERNADLEKALEQQKEKTANAVKKLAEDEIRMRELTKKNDAETTKECSRLEGLLTSAEEELSTIKQKNSEQAKEVAVLLESKETIENELMAKKVATNKLHRELAELREAFFKVSEERNQYLESLEQKLAESGGSESQEQQLYEANQFIAAKVEEIRKLQSIVASKDRDNQMLADQIVLMEEHLKICQRCRVQYEKKITALGTEVQSLRSAQKRYSETWSDSILSKLSEEIPEVKDEGQQYRWNDFNQYPCETNVGDPMGHQSGDNFASVSELISRERMKMDQHDKERSSELPSSVSFYQNPEYQSRSSRRERPQVVTILRPYRRVRLTPEMRLQPISSLMSGLLRPRQSCVSSTEQAKAKDLFLMSNNVYNK